MRKSFVIVMAIISMCVWIAGCGDSSDGSKGEKQKKEQIIAELDSLLSDFPNEQKDFLIYGKEASSDDKASAWLNLTNEGKLERYTELKEKLLKAK